MTLEEISEGLFAENVNTKFRVPLRDGQSTELELFEVTGYKAGPDEHAGLERFSLFFRGTGDLYLPQSIYRLEHERLGEFDIFIVPIARGAEGYNYQAVINRQAVRRD